MMQQRCPSCGRAWVPGEARCPFCGAAPGVSPAPPGVPLPPPGMPAGPATAFQLQWVDRWGRPQSRPIPPQGLRLGRDPGNDVVLDDAQVSRQHAFVAVQGGQCYVQDLGSANGTFVNETRIGGPQFLKVGDRLRLGETSFVLAAAAVPVGYPPPAMPVARPGWPGGVPVSRPAQPAAAPSIGRILALVGAVIVLVMFFLPWFQAGPIGVSAFDLLRALGYAGELAGPAVASEVWRAWLLLVVPLAGLFALILAIAGLFVEDRLRASFSYAQVVLALLAIGVLVWLFVEAATSAPISLTELFGLGYWGSLVGAVLIIVGSILDVALPRRI